MTSVYEKMRRTVEYGQRVDPAIFPNAAASYILHIAEELDQLIGGLSAEQHETVVTQLYYDLCELGGTLSAAITTADLQADENTG